MKYVLPHEMGPIRPPSEARSLLIRVTRNCPWNRCEFCHVYAGQKFEIKSVEEIKKDILQAEMYYGDMVPYFRSAFLQDANSIIMRTKDLIEVISFLKERFPGIERITTYGRGNTLAKKSVEELKELRRAGLSRIHMGLETGYEPLLQYIKKGATVQQMIEGGKKVTEAGLSLCVYIILGLGGKKMWKEHALSTANVINQINPHFIRVRTLSIRPGTPLEEKWKRGDFIRLNDEEIVKEERLLIENLQGIDSYFVSDHILNLLEEIEGRLPKDKEKMLNIIDRFLGLPEKERWNFMLGRRAFVYRRLEDLTEQRLYERVDKSLNQILAENPDGLQEILYQFMEKMV